MTGYETEILDKIQNANRNAELWLTRETFNILSVNARVILREEDCMPMLTFINKDGAVSIVFSLNSRIFDYQKKPITVQVHEVNYCSGKQLKFPFMHLSDDPTII